MPCQDCRYRLTTLVFGLSPITVPPVLCVVWYCVTVYGPLRGVPATCLAPMALPISTALAVTYAAIFKSFCGKSNVIRSTGWPQASR